MRKPAQIKPLAEKAKADGEPLTFAMTFPPRHPRDVDPVLAGLRRRAPGQGHQPDHDSTRPDGRQHEGRQDGRVLRRRAVEQPGDRTASASAITTQQMWKDHPEKVCAFTEEFAMKPKSVKAVLKALHLASVDLDKMENRPKFAEVISRPPTSTARRRSSSSG